MRASVKPEVMDDPSLDQESLCHALKGLRRLNWLSAVSLILWKEIERWATVQNKTSLKILDVACGSGEVLRGIMRRAHRKGVMCMGHGIDCNALTITHARALTDSRFEIEYAVGDALAINHGVEFDVVLSTLFLHHLSNEDGTRLILRMQAQSKGLILLHDLERSTMGTLLALTIPRIVTTSRVVHNDAHRSVENAYSFLELRELVKEAGVSHALFKRTWPCRMLAVWERNNA